MLSRRLLRSLRLSSALFCLLPGVALGQASVLQGGAFAPGRVPIYSAGGSGSQPVVIDSGPAGSTVTGQGVSELNITARCATPPCAGTGTGPDGTIFTINDAVSTNSTGGHRLAFSANALGGGLLEYGAFGTATALPFNFKVNGTTYAFPFVTGGIVGPGTTVVGHLATWNNTTGTLLADGGVALSIGGTNGQVQINNSGSLGGITLNGDVTVNAGTGATTVNTIQGFTIVTGGAIHFSGLVNLSGDFTLSGNDSLVLRTTANSDVTLPVSGTLSTLAGSEAFTNKTYNGLTINSTTGTFALTNGKTLTVSNTLGLTGTDSSTLNIGTGGTLGTAAYTAASAYVPSNTQITNSLSGDVLMNNTANYFDGPSVAQGATGTWFASGTVTATEGAVAGAGVFCKLWDGTTVISSGAMYVQGPNSDVGSIALSGRLATPVGNLRISCRSPGSITGNILFNQTGNSRDSTLTAFRIN